ncbi:protein VASCULAR ASSOCIATED DEATH 1, chloroplastic isoform X2 [Amborella trichopoda]|uniref:protein VASCULAR ASSOCIATED DEATH 1, chloroplastic isoform X2 n=1 Tax=Amborella trichopoda TaxID=13333 RepID=UPI0005D36A8C|nr:protein VASCULAR ASSOCIATED DEATH 1, chloroplastic isoform X2 [Amborella trichopoda]|eukprot:XP_011621202.1 protein VASCULAR ASSOCIATED DEATH 1, chloroplastic isoform X2 [Amborella trichopoda]
MEPGASESAAELPDNVSESSRASVSSQDHEDLRDSTDKSVQDRKEAELQASSARSEEYRLLFHLPAEEVLVQDFNCAFQENILLQGHMYLFVHHVCFYSNIFGFETKRTIPFQDVSCVRKAKTAGFFPNAIEIVAGGKKHFFASFLSRDEAYRLIVHGWSLHSDDAKLLLDCQELKTESSNQDNILLFFDRLKTFKLVGAAEIDSVDRSNNETQLFEESIKLENNDGNSSEAPDENLSEVQVIREEEPALESSNMPSMGALAWKPEDVDAPKIPEHYKMVAESKFSISVEQFFQHFFSNSAVGFVEAFHNRCGDKNFKCTSWYEHEQFGHARDFSFQHPIKIYFGAKFANCQEVQKFRVYKDSHLVVETSQQMSDVPFGEHFRVEGLWDVQKGDNEESECCTLRVYVNVAFLRKVMFRGKIEQGTSEECREAYALWIDLAHDLLKRLQIENTRTSEALKIPQSAYDAVVKDAISPKPANQQESSNLSSITSLLRELCSSFYEYLKSQSSYPALIIVILLLCILVLMQVSIVVLLTRGPKIHMIPQESYMNSFGGERKEAIAWMEKRVHHLKEEIFFIEARLDKMRHEYELLKSHLQGLL